MRGSPQKTRRFLAVAVGAGALVVSTAGPAGAAVVMPGAGLDGWKLVAESSGAAQLDVDAGWVTAAAAGRGSALLPSIPGVQTSLGTDNYTGLLSAITSMKVTVKTAGTGVPPRVVLRVVRPSAPTTACNYTFNIPASASWTTYDLTAAGNAFWTNNSPAAACPAFPSGNWTALKATLGAMARIDEGVLDGVTGIRIQAGDTSTATYLTTYVDSFEFNGELSNFEPPTVSLTGASASLPAGGSIDLPVAAVLSGPNQPAFGNFLGPITGNGGLPASAKVTVASSPAGLCNLTPATFTFAPESGLSVAKPRYSIAPPLKLTTKAGNGGTCTLSLGSAVNATAAGKVTVKITPTPTRPPATGPVTTCVAKAVSHKSKLKVNMGPNLPGDGYYKFRIDVKKNGKWFRYLKQMKTQGAGETRTVNVPKGTYRAKCYGPTEAQDSRSQVVKIKK